MTAEGPVADLVAARRSPLGAWAERLEREGHGPALSMAVDPFRTLVDVRVGAVAAGATAADAAALDAALGFALPHEPLTWVGRGGVLACWLGPGWWLLDAPSSVPDAGEDAEWAVEARLVRSLRAACGGPAAGPAGGVAGVPLGGSAASVVDVSSHRTALELSGADARTVLAHGCAIDLHPRSFGVGSVVQTMLAKAQVVLAQTGDEPTYRLWVRASFARYLAAWLLDAAAEYIHH